MMAGFGRDVEEICVLLGYYTGCFANLLPTFRDSLSVPYSRTVAKSQGEITTNSWPFNM